jgi:hypothetical protein
LFTEGNYTPFLTISVSFRILTGMSLRAREMALEAANTVHNRLPPVLKSREPEIENMEEIVVDLGGKSRKWRKWRKWRT